MNTKGKKWFWLKEYMMKNNITQTDVAEALQWQKTRVSELLCGKRDFPVNKVFPAAKFFNLDLEELTKYNSGFTKDIPLVEGKKPLSKPENRMAEIDIIIPQINETFEQKITFQIIGKQMISEMIFNMLTNSNPLDIKMLIAHGDAMQPTIYDGDFVWVDFSIKVPEEDGLYIFAMKGEIFIKRLQLDKFNHSALIISDNPLYPPISIAKPEKLTTLGKIIALTKSYH